VAVGLVLAVPLYVGLAKAGLIRSPFFPKVEGDLTLARSDSAGLRVLFVGNSFTYYNSMPSLVRRLAEADAGSPSIIAVAYTAPNWTLERAAEDDGLADLLGDVRWNVVVLQEHNQLVSFSYPFARALWREITLVGGRTVLFMTWAYEDGDRRNFPGDTFTAMQARLGQDYSQLSEELTVPVAPVGLAWAEALRRRPGVKLWAGDGRHPSRIGSYLAACVFYAVLSGRDPRGSEFTAELGESEARFLQDVAADVVTLRKN
jgi:hypothetical protein